MCRGSEAGSYLRLIDCVHHSTKGLRVLKKERKSGETARQAAGVMSLISKWTRTPATSNQK